MERWRGKEVGAARDEFYDTKLCFDDALDEAGQKQEQKRRATYQKDVREKLITKSKKATQAIFQQLRSN